MELVLDCPRVLAVWARELELSPTQPTGVDAARQIMGKDLIRKALGRSPDRLDTVIIGLAVSLGRMRNPKISSSQAAI